MTTYLVRHRTTYRYQSDVAYSRLVTHLVPRTTVRQRPLAVEVTVTPNPVGRFERSDFFGNTTSNFVVDAPHDELEIIASSHVTVEPIAPFGSDEGLPWEAVRTMFEPPVAAEMFDTLQYTFDTPLTATDADVADYARTSFPEGRPLLACALELNSRIHADFTYKKGATNTHTTVKEAFALKAGVCQDLAHIGIACARAMGLAARYVSGYLRTHPPPGRERLLGADASHAWFAVWIPSFGWVDFDPTNDMLPSNEHITVGWGREYSDVAPIHGIITGGGSDQDVDVGVDVIPA